MVQRRRGVAQVAGAVALTFHLLTLGLTPALLLVALGAWRLAAGESWGVQERAKERAAARHKEGTHPPYARCAVEVNRWGSEIMAADKTAGTLNQLIAACRDAEEFYGYAAERVSGSQLPPLLRETAGLHREIGDALRPHVRGAGASPAEGGTLAGKFRQLKGGLKATLASDTEAALAPDLEQTEQAVVQAFERALAEPMDPAAKTLVADKLGVLKATHARIAEIARRATPAQNSSR